MKVKVNHWRLVPAHYVGAKDKQFALVRMRDLADRTIILARGGATQVRMYSDDGELLSEGASFCHPKENFCRKTGREFALRYASYGMPSNYHPPIVDMVEIPEELKKFV